MKLEDLVQNQNEKIDSLYDEYDSIMNEIISSGLNDAGINRLNDAGINLFNYMDKCYSELDAAEESDSNAKQSQLINLSCLFSDAFEKTIPYHYLIMRRYHGDENYSISKHAFFGMQQLIVQCKNKNEVSKLRQICIENKLPTKGFEVKREFKVTKIQKIVAQLISAILSLIAMVVILLYLDIDDTPKYKFAAFSVLISILGGISATLLSGVFNIKIKGSVATSGFAVFVLIFCGLQGIRLF